MVQRIEYKVKIDKNGREYALKRNVKTGKTTQCKVKYAKKRISDNKYRRNRNEIEPELKKKGSNWKEYQKKRKEAKKPPGHATPRDKPPGHAPPRDKPPKEDIIDDIPEVRTRIRFNWRYWTMPCHESPDFMADSVAQNGDYFNEMVAYAKETLKEIKAMDLCMFGEKLGLIGGCCVVLYNKKTKETYKQFEQGDGCY